MRHLDRQRNGLRMLLTTFVICMMCSSARADLQYTPGFPPVLQGGNIGAHALDWNYNIFDVASTASNGKSDHNTVYPSGNNDVESVGRFDIGASHQYPNPYNTVTEADSSLAASVAWGQMHADVDSLAKIGYADATANVYVDFIDLLHIVAPGVPHFSLHLSGDSLASGTGGYSSSIGQAEMWFWPFDGNAPPAGGTLFDFTYHEKHVRGPSSTTDEMTSNFDTNLAVDSYWWLAARLTVQSNAHIGSQTGNGTGVPAGTEEGFADFSHTAVLNIDPDLSTPNFAYISDSGADYSTRVPEPTTILLAVGAIGICPRRRRAAGRRSHRVQPRISLRRDAII